jgi:hypothetical protein
MTQEQVKEKIKKNTEWFKLFGMLFVLENGGIGLIISNNSGSMILMSLFHY